MAQPMKLISSREMDENDLQYLMSKMGRFGLSRAELMRYNDLRQRLNNARTE